MTDMQRWVLIVALASCAAPALPEAPDEWTRVVAACGHSFRAPPGTTGGETAGTDSCVTQYETVSCSLSGDAGGFSDPLTSYTSEAEYVEGDTVIDGRSARWITYDGPDSMYVAAVHFPAFAGEGARLTLYASCTSSDDRDEMLALFGTVRAVP
jgi:hypothetical protein